MLEHAFIQCDRFGGLGHVKLPGLHSLPPSYTPTVSPALSHCLAHTEADGFAVARYLMVGFVAVTDPNVRETIVEEDSKESDDPDEPEWVDQTPQQAEQGDHSTLGRYWSLIQATSQR